MSAATGGGMIVPGPARGHIDLEGNLAAHALTGGGLAGRDGSGFFLRRLFLVEHCGASILSTVIASEAKQSSFLRCNKKAGLLRRCAPRNVGLGLRLRQLVVLVVIGIARLLTAVKSLAVVRRQREAALQAA